MYVHFFNEYVQKYGFIQLTPLSFKYDFFCNVNKIVNKTSFLVF